MGKIKVTWQDIDQRILLWEFIGSWEWDEYLESVKIAYEMVRSVAPNRVDIIAALAQSSGLPANVVSKVAQASRTMPKNWELTVVVGGGTFIDTMVNIGRRLVRDMADKYAIAPNVEAAMTLIAEARYQKERETTP